MRTCADCINCRVVLKVTQVKNIGGKDYSKKVHPVFLQKIMLGERHKDTKVYCKAGEWVDGNGEEFSLSGVGFLNPDGCRGLPEQAKVGATCKMFDVTDFWGYDEMKTWEVPKRWGKAV